MDIKSLKQFQHLSSSLNYSKTAAATFVSAPTLTRTIMRLEEQFGVSLFVRNNRNVQLTNAGQQVLAFTDDTLNRLYQLQSTLSQQQGSIKGELSLYCSVTAAQTYLPNILDKMRAQYPLIDIKLETGDHELALARLSASEQEQLADVAIAIHTPNFPAHIHFHAIDTVPLTLIVPKSLKHNSIAGIDWRNTKVILPARGPSRRIVHHWFAEQNIRPNIYAKVSGNEAIVSMVSLGLGIGFVPRLVLENSTAQTKVLSIDVNNIEAYRVGLCYLKERANDGLIKSISSLLSL